MKEVTLVLCVSNKKDDDVRYYLHDIDLDGFVIPFDYQLYTEILNLYCGNVYALGYLYNGKFFDQLVYLGKGKRSA